MKEVSVPWKDQRRGVDHAVMLSQWCKDQGLAMNRDYEWYFRKDSNETVFQFFGDAESFSTLFLLKWVGDER